MKTAWSLCEWTSTKNYIAFKPRAGGSTGRPVHCCPPDIFFRPVRVRPWYFLARPARPALFFWVCRPARVRPLTFQARPVRPVIFFGQYRPARSGPRAGSGTGLRAYPYPCRALTPGEPKLHGVFVVTNPNFSYRLVNIECTSSLFFEIWSIFLDKF